jgi:CRISPR-associated endonuclease/helicase Cas3
MGEYYAHSKENLPESQWQTLDAHLTNVSTIAGIFAASFGAREWGTVVGRLHDLGKYGDDFQLRIRGEKIRADHSTPGAKYTEKLIKEPRGAGRLLAYCIAGHHAGIPDGDSGEDDSCLVKRIERCIYDFSEYAGPLDRIKIPTCLQPAEGNEKSRIDGFAASFFVRMLFSCLVDADFLDTEAYIDPERASKRNKYLRLPQIKQMLDSHLDSLARKAPKTAVNELRALILQESRVSADKAPGLFSLTVPTGGGKTLSSLAFATDHALKYKMDRIIYVIPYTSIIEQTAAVFKGIFGPHSVLEHHSNIIIEKDSTDEEEEENRRLAAENWDAPIVVTTNVQFFESFFSNRSSKTRKLHNVANSVVILDEAQMLPVPFLRPTLAAMRELTSHYGATLVLCTATQPALSERQDFKGGLSGVREMMSDPKKLEKAFKRVKAEYIGELVDKDILSRLLEEKQVLCIVNTKKHARLIFEGLGADDGSYHLSAAMCPMHRRLTLEAIKKRLRNGEICRVVSTQLVEAGVDLDFPVVFRSLAGIDSVVQAAGRCNREGKLSESGRVYVFVSEEYPPPGYLKQTAQISERILRNDAKDILSAQTTEEYFKELYWLNDSSGKLDSKQIVNRFKDGIVHGDFPFSTIASEYKIIANAQESVIVPFDDAAAALCAELKNVVRLGWSIGGFLKRLQPYTVQVYKKPLDALIDQGFVTMVDERIYLLSELGKREAYSEQYGLNPASNEFIEVENLMY